MMFFIAAPLLPAAGSALPAASAVFCSDAGQLQEDIFQAQADAAQLIQIPAGVDHGARQVGANLAALQALDFKAQAAVLGLLRQPRG